MSSPIPRRIKEDAEAIVVQAAREFVRADRQNQDTDAEAAALRSAVAVLEQLEK